MTVKSGGSAADTTVAGCPPIVTVTALTVWESRDDGAATPASTAGSTGPKPAQEMITVSPSVTGLSASTTNCVPSGLTPATSAAPLPVSSLVKMAGWTAATVTGSGTE